MTTATDHVSLLNAPCQVPMAALRQLQQDYLERATTLWNQSLNAVPPLPSDRRFAAPEWSNDAAASLTAQMYLLNARTMQAMAEALTGEKKTRERIRFAVQQWIDAASPSNYLALNPEARRKAIDSQGESLVAGWRMFLNDLRQGRVSQTDESVFEIGRNVATTEGTVIYENELFQLIEYKPLTPKVHARPLLFVPPCINKFYILDLQPSNSLIRYAVEEGHRVFMLSWRNADESIKHFTWDDYVDRGVIRAIELVQQFSPGRRINTLGFCVGGTLLANALAVLAARGEKPAESLTLLTTFLDFSDTGVLDLFIDEGLVALREMTIGAQSPTGPQLLKGLELASTFSFLRPNELVWNYVVGNYLKGETPRPFDLLYWNSDGTNLPGPMYCWYLRNTYLENNLITPNRLTVCGEKLDLRLIDAPSYVLASREDHIVPWASAYQSVHHIKGPSRFVLGASGHIAGVINPPANRKRSHWIGNQAKLPSSAKAWEEGAVEHAGSWWPDWSKWLALHAGERVAAPVHYGNSRHPPIEPAPGRYVKQKAG